MGMAKTTREQLLDEFLSHSPDTLGIPRAPLIEGHGDTSRVIEFSESNDVGEDCREIAEKLDILNQRADDGLLQKFDQFFDLMKLL